MGCGPRYPEDFGGLPDAAGVVTLDASVMRSPSQCGGVCCVRRHLDVTRLARLVMETTPHVMLAGQSVDGFASAHGIPERSLLAPGAREAWLRWQRDPRSVDQSRDSGLRPRDDGKNATGALCGADMDRWVQVQDRTVSQGEWGFESSVGVRIYVYACM